MKRDLRSLIGWGVTALLAVIVVAGMIIGDARPEDRVAALGSQIKCPVCQGEAIADSPSETAEAMMQVVEEKVAAGESDQQILAYFESRFGEGILLDPPFAGKTLLVWILPFVAVVAGVWMILTRRRSPATTGADSP